MKVFIVGGNVDYHKMFENRGWEVTPNEGEADLVQFCGGADVSPHLYGEPMHPRTGCNPYQDEYEATIFEVCKAAGTPMAGICRGGQFLNVMNGGSMYQDVDNHAIFGTHPVVDVMSNRTIEVSSTHHQMMRPAEHGEVLATASRATRKEGMNSLHQIVKFKDEEDDVEVVLYEDSSSLCFQPHPEFSVGDPAVADCADYYFELLDALVLNGEHMDNLEVLMTTL